MAIVQPSWAKKFRTRLHSASSIISFASSYILNIGNMGLVKDAAGGTLVNGRTSTATVIDFEGNVVDCLSGEIRYDGGRRADHADGQMYNAGVLGIEYFDTEADGITLISPAPSPLHEGEGTNYAFPASTPATQTITLAAGDYTVWLDDTDGLGTITLSGDATGIANSTDINGFQFTSTGGATTFTHAGSNNVRWKVEGGNYRTSFTDTTTAAVTRAADDISIALAEGTTATDNFNNAQGILEFDWTAGYASGDTELGGLVSLTDGLYSLLYRNSESLISYDGTAFANIISSYVPGDRIKVSVCWNDAESLFSINYSLDQGVTWSTWVQAAYDGAFIIGTDINLFFDNPYINNLHSAKIYGSLPSGGTIAEAQTWVENN